MKKAIFASILMLATLTACQNGENLTSNAPEEQQKQTFQSKTATRGEDLAKLSPEEEKAVIEEAIKYLQEDRDANLKGEGGTSRAAQILCHTNYNSSYGHACVYNSSGYLVTVSWEPQPRTGDIGTVGGPVHYHGSVTSQCNC